MRVGLYSPKTCLQITIVLCAKNIIGVLTFIEKRTKKEEEKRKPMSKAIKRDQFWKTKRGKEIRNKTIIDGL